MTPVTAEQLNSEIFCRIAPSKLHGVGIIAIRDIPKGTLFNQYWNEWYGKRIEISHDEWEKVDPEIKDIILASGMFTDGLEGFYHIDHPNTHHCLFFNHAETPNSKEGVALEDIKKGEEVTRYCNGVHEKVLEHFASQGITIQNDDKPN